MDIGEKIVNLRKQKGLSQELLAEKVGVARQTISKWELNETSPDLKQAKELSKILEVSLDELVGNDIENLLMSKVSNTEKLAGLVIKILKVIGILFVCYFILMVIGIICFTVFRKEQQVSNVKSATMMCSMKNSNYEISVESDGYFNCLNCDQEMQKYLKNNVDFSDMEKSIQNIKAYFVNNGGSCE